MGVAMVAKMSICNGVGMKSFSILDKVTKGVWEIQYVSESSKNYVRVVEKHARDHL